MKSLLISYLLFVSSALMAQAQAPSAVGTQNPQTTTPTQGVSLKGEVCTSYDKKASTWSACREVDIAVQTVMVDGQETTLYLVEGNLSSVAMTKKTAFPIALLFNYRSGTDYGNPENTKFLAHSIKLKGDKAEYARTFPPNLAGCGPLAPDPILKFESSFKSLNEQKKVLENGRWARCGVKGGIEKAFDFNAPDGALKSFEGLQYSWESGGFSIVAYALRLTIK